MNDKLSEIFDLEPIEYKSIAPKQTDIIPNDSNHEEFINDDYEHVRFNMRDLLNTGKDALLDALEVAKQSEHPRAYEVVGRSEEHTSELQSH